MVFSSIEENVSHFLREIPKSVTIIAVTKTIGVENIKRAVLAGLNNVGENRVQEAIDKYQELKDLKLTWHLIGSLQSNKIKKALQIFDLIHSVDKVRLAEEINKEAQKIGKKQEILLQVNVSGEESKSGFSIEELKLGLPEIAKMEHLLVKGLMTIAPNTEDEKLVAYCFSSLKKLLTEINEKKYFEKNLDILSMGMSNDYKIAIVEGSSMIRLGRAIFGERS